METRQVVIEEWEGDGGIRIPDEALQELGVDVGDSLYLIEEYVGTTRCLVLSKTPRIPDLNARMGYGTIQLARVPAPLGWGMRQELKSPSYVSRWIELRRVT